TRRRSVPYWRGSDVPRLPEPRHARTDQQVQPVDGPPARAIPYAVANRRDESTTLAGVPERTTRIWRRLFGSAGILGGSGYRRRCNAVPRKKDQGGNMQNVAAKLWTPQEAAEHWRVNVVTVYRWIRAHQIMHIVVGRSYRIPHEQVMGGVPAVTKV